MSIGFAESNVETSRQVRHSSVLALVHAPQLVNSKGGASNDGSLDQRSDDRNSITSHGDALQSAEDSANAEGRLSSSGDRSYRDTSVNHSKEGPGSSVLPAAGPALVKP
jgi:hypothetical protein